jgi:hypothetical protein
VTNYVQDFVKLVGSLILLRSDYDLPRIEQVRRIAA